MTGPRYNKRQRIFAIEVGDRVQTLYTGRHGRVLDVRKWLKLEPNASDKAEAYVQWDDGDGFWLRCGHLRLEETGATGGGNKHG